MWLSTKNKNIFSAHFRKSAEDKSARESLLSHSPEDVASTENLSWLSARFVR